MNTASVTVKVADLPKVKAEIERLCEEVARLRAENATLQKAYDRLYARLYGPTCDRRPCTCGMHRDWT